MAIRFTISKYHSAVAAGQVRGDRWDFTPGNRARLSPARRPEDEGKRVTIQSERLVHDEAPGNVYDVIIDGEQTPCAVDAHRLVLLPG